MWLDFSCFFLFFDFFVLSVLLFFFFDFLRFILSESDELKLEDVSDSEIWLDGELDVKELDDDDDDDELRYFRFLDFLVLDLLLPWFALEPFLLLGTPAASAESQRPEKEACWTGNLTFSCGVYESRLFRLFSPFFSPGCLNTFPGVANVVVFFYHNDVHICALKQSLQ